MDDGEEVTFAHALLTGEDAGVISASDLGLPPDYLPELVIAITRPQGADDHTVVSEIREEFTQHGFLATKISLAGLIREAGNTFPTDDLNTRKISERAGFDRTHDLMSIGDSFRATLGRDVAAKFAIVEIQRIRREHQAEAVKRRKKGLAYILTTLVHPAEVALLRSVYKHRFFLVGVHENFESRLHRLTETFRSTGSVDPHSAAMQIIEIDSGIRPSHGDLSDSSLNIDQTFHKADLFFLAGDGRSIKDSRKEQIQRWLDLVFGSPWESPSIDEYGMANAYIAARQSIALGRSVGAAIMSDEGQVLAHGWNEPARPFGGVSRDGLLPDLREHHDGFDSSDRFRIEAIREFLHQLVGKELGMEIERLRLKDPNAAEWLHNLYVKINKLMPPDEHDVRVMAAFRSIATTRLLNLIEFGRSVHAEMAAITSAARRGTAIADAVLYVTTLPCHECSRNVVASGIRRVVYVEPYGKSLADKLYEKSIQMTSRESGAKDDGRLAFEQFLGIAPSAQEFLFSNVVRKHSLQLIADNPSLGTGSIVEWSRSSGSLRPSIRGYVDDSGRTDPFFEAGKIYAETSIANELRQAVRREYPSGQAKTRDQE